MEPELGKDAVELAQLWDQLALILFFQVCLRPDAGFAKIKRACRWKGSHHICMLITTAGATQLGSNMSSRE